MATPQPVELHRLSEAAYVQLVKQLGQPPIITSETTELQAAFRLGIQFTLDKLREGFVV